jgi:isocitrate lyase
VIVRYAVVPDSREADPTVAPSMVKVTVPVGTVVPEMVAVRFAVTCIVVPAVGVVLAGTTVRDVELFEAVTFTLVDATLV